MYLNKNLEGTLNLKPTNNQLPAASKRTSVVADSFWNTWLYIIHRSFKRGKLAEQVEVEGSWIGSDADFCLFIAVVLCRTVLEEYGVVWFLVEVALHRFHWELLHFVVFELYLVVSSSIFKSDLDSGFFAHVGCYPYFLVLLTSYFDVEGIFLGTAHVLIVKHKPSAVLEGFVDDCF